MNIKPVPATSDPGGKVGKSLEVKGPGREVTARDGRKAGNGMGKVGEQGTGGQRKGYGERTGVKAGGGGGHVQPLPKPAVSKPSKDAAPRTYTQYPS